MTTKQEQKLDILRTEYHGAYDRFIKASMEDMRQKQRDYAEEMEKRAWSGWDTTTVSKLTGLTCEQLEFLYFKRIHADTRVRSEYSTRPYASEEHKKQALYDALFYESCRYCKSVFHKIDLCPTLRRKIDRSAPCSFCKCTFHGVAECSYAPHKRFG